MLSASEMLEEFKEVRHRKEQLRSETEELDHMDRVLDYTLESIENDEEYFDPSHALELFIPPYAPEHVRHPEPVDSMVEDIPNSVEQTVEEMVPSVDSPSEEKLRSYNLLEQFQEELNHVDSKISRAEKALSFLEKTYDLDIEGAEFDRWKTEWSEASTDYGKVFTKAFSTMDVGLDTVKKVASMDERFSPELAEQTEKEAKRVPEDKRAELPEQPVSFGLNLSREILDVYREEVMRYEDEEEETANKSRETTKSTIQGTKNSSYDKKPINWGDVDESYTNEEQNVLEEIAELDDPKLEDVRDGFYWAWLEQNDLHLKEEEPEYTTAEERGRVKEVKKAFESYIQEDMNAGKGKGNYNELTELLALSRSLRGDFDEEGYAKP